MSTINPSTDNTSVVVHARKSTFVMLIVSAIILATTFFQAPKDLIAAIEELKSINAMLPHVQDTFSRATAEPVPLPEVLLNEDQLLQSKLVAYRITVENPPLPPVYRPLLPSYEEGIQGTCTFAIEKQVPYFVTTDDRVENLVVRSTANGPRLFVAPLDDNSSPSNLFPLSPVSVADFKDLWNELTLSTVRAYVESVDESSGAFLFPNTGSGPTNLLPVSKSVELVTNLPSSWKETVAESHGEFVPAVPTGLVMLGELREEHFLNSPFIVQAMLLAWSHSSYLMGEPSRTLNRKRDRNFLVLMGRCYPDGDTQKLTRPLRVAVRAQIRYMDTNWTENLFVRTGNLKEQFGRAPQFTEAFPNLSRRLVRHERHTFDEVKDVLQADMPPEVSEISFFDVTVPFDFLYDLGIVVVLLCQIYATLHLVEVKARVARSDLGDPGAFVPWIILYRQRWAQVISVSLLGVPFLVVFRVLYISVFPTLADRSSNDPNVLFQLLCVVVVLLLTVISWQSWEALSRQADAHRAATRDIP